MNFLDIVLGILLIWGFINGLKNGLFVEIASLAALIAGIFGAIHFAYMAGEYLSKKVDWSESYINLAAFIITFIVIVLVVNLLGMFLTKIANFAMLGILNKIAGAIFGALKVAVILGALLVFFERSNAALDLEERTTVRESALYEPIKEIGAFVFNAVLKKEETDSQEELRV